MIEVRNFSKVYKKSYNPVVSRVHITAKPGITGLLGLNGAGKTTVIKAVAALHYASQGSVRVSDEDGIFFDASEHPDTVRSLIGYVPETAALPLKLTVAEYLRFTQDIYAPRSGTKKQDFERTVAEWEIQDVLQKKIGELSKGFRQRVSFAQCCIYNPPNIVLDEPVNGLDPAQIIQFRRIIKEKSASKTVLISTHLMQEVHSLCDFIYILAGKTVAAAGTEQEIVGLTGTSDIESAFLSVTGTASGMAGAEAAD